MQKNQAVLYRFVYDRPKTIFFQLMIFFRVFVDDIIFRYSIIKFPAVPVQIFSAVAAFLHFVIHQPYFLFIKKRFC